MKYLTESRGVWCGAQLHPSVNNRIVHGVSWIFMFWLTSAKILPLLNGKITVGGEGSAEVDMMNQAELIYDNSCFIASKVRLVTHALYAMASLRPILIKLRWVNFQKSMGHEDSNERASVNVRRGGCAFRLKKKKKNF